MFKVCDEGGMKVLYVEANGVKVKLSEPLEEDRFCDFLSGFATGIVLFSEVIEEFFHDVAERLRFEFDNNRSCNLL